MKPQNNKERRNSFLKFFLMFLFTVALIVAAFFFDFDRLPFKENNVLRERSASLEQEMKFQEKFTNGMKDVVSMIDSLDAPGQNKSYINSLVSTKIVDLKKSIPQRDSTYRYIMYNNIVDSYVEIQELKTKLNSLDEEVKKLDEYKEEILRLRTDLTQAQRDLAIYARRR